jgi:hypothetical protein
VGELQKIVNKLIERGGYYASLEYKPAEKRRVVKGHQKDTQLLNELLAAVQSNNGTRAKATLAKIDPVLRAVLPKDTKEWASQYSRPGAKARMGHDVMDRLKAIGANLKKADEARHLLRDAMKAAQWGNAAGTADSIQYLYRAVGQAFREVERDSKSTASRPGAKAKFAVDRKAVIRDLEYLRDEARRTRNNSARIDAENWLKNVRKGNLTEQDWIEAEEAASYIYEEVQGRFSRPGHPERFLRIDPRSVDRWEASAGQKIDSVGPATWIFVDPSGKEIWIPRPMRFRDAVVWLVVNQKQAKPNDYYKVASSRPGAKAVAAKPEVEETEEQKAGLKIMSAADPKVSDKIRTLIKEGKPQDQAVAIALDMKRRGEL